ncbi:MAG TPA: hypothetical protein VE865_12470 [Bradyrhizobium sp.]|nr:hypothetical protein [Bradyrhizobium sp.]
MSYQEYTALGLATRCLVTKFSRRSIYDQASVEASPSTGRRAKGAPKLHRIFFKLAALRRIWQEI